MQTNGKTMDMLKPFDAASLEVFNTVKATGDAFRTVLEPEDFERAAAEISAWEGYEPTPLHRLDALAKAIGVDDILYKDEGPRFGLSSFKALGGAYAAERILAREIGNMLGRKILLADVREGRFAKEASRITLASATDGNHGRSLAWGARRFGAQCKIFIHAEVSEGRAQAMRDLGADVIRIDGDYDDSLRIVREEASANGWFIVSDTSWEGYSDAPRDVMAGYGVMVDEAVSAFDRLSTNMPPSHVFVQGGVGGLAAAVFARLRQKWGNEAPRMIVVEPELAACLLTSARAGKAVAVSIDEETVMAGLSCGEPSALAWDIIRQEASDFIAIPDTIVGPAMKLLASPLGNDPVIEAGESAVAGLAALIAAMRHPDIATKLGLGAESRVLLFGTEGVTDPVIYRQMIAA